MVKNSSRKELTGLCSKILSLLKTNSSASKNKNFTNYPRLRTFCGPLSNQPLHNPDQNLAKLCTCVFLVIDGISNNKEILANNKTPKYCKRSFQTAWEI